MHRGFSHCRTQVVAPAREADARKDLSPSYYSYDSDSQAQLCQFQLCKYQYRCSILFSPNSSTKLIARVKYSQYIYCVTDY